MFSLELGGLAQKALVDEPPKTRSSRRLDLDISGCRNTSGIGGIHSLLLLQNWEILENLLGIQILRISYSNHIGAGKRARRGISGAANGVIIAYFRHDNDTVVTCSRGDS